MDSHRRQQQQLLGEAAVNALCSNLPSRTSAQTAGMAMAWDVCLCLGRRVASCPLPACLYVRCAVVRHAWSSLYRHVDAATDGQACALHALTETIDCRVRV
jgi:hypothetical protein